MSSSTLLSMCPSCPRHLSVWRRKDVDLNLVALGNHQTASHSVWFAFSAQSVTRTLKEVPPPLSFDPLTPLPLEDNSAGQR